MARCFWKDPSFRELSLPAAYLHRSLCHHDRCVTAACFVACPFTQYYHQVLSYLSSLGRTVAHARVPSVCRPRRSRMRHTRPFQRRNLSQPLRQPRFRVNLVFTKVSARRRAHFQASLPVECRIRHPLHLFLCPSLPPQIVLSPAPVVQTDMHMAMAVPSASAREWVAICPVCLIDEAAKAIFVVARAT